MANDPVFKPGDRVVSFRGELATVERMTREGGPHRSAKVHVRWDDGWEGEYYSTVFTLV